MDSTDWQFTTRQRLAAALAGVTILGVAGTWYGVDYYVDQADCGAEVKKANANATVARSQLATQQNKTEKQQAATDHRVIIALGDIAIDPPRGGAGPAFQELFRTNKIENRRLDNKLVQIAKERERHPILPLPPECGAN